jgi:hypothetical protein
MIRFGVVVAGLLAAGVASAADPGPADFAAMTAPVKKLVVAINTGAVALPAGVFTDDASVQDDFGPYRWVGPGAAAAWYTGLIGGSAKEQADFRAMKAVLTVSAPKYARITGDTAYFVLPSVFVFNDSGKRIHQTGAWIMSERREGKGWLIAGHAWAITGETPSDK